DAAHEQSRDVPTVMLPLPPAAGTSDVLFWMENEHLLPDGPVKLVLADWQTELATAPATTSASVKRAESAAPVRIERQESAGCYARRPTSGVSDHSDAPVTIDPRRPQRQQPQTERDDRQRPHVRRSWADDVADVHRCERGDIPPQIDAAHSIARASHARKS